VILTLSVQLHTYATNGIHPNTALKMKNKSFFVLV